MEIIYKELKDYSTQDLKDVFLSVEWSSGNYPERLVKAMKNSASVFSAWDGENLVGIINVLDDGEMTAYVPYLLINPQYQGKGIGKRLVELVKDKYKNYLTLVLVSYDKQVPFYQKCGFRKEQDKEPLFISDMKL